MNYLEERKQIEEQLLHKIIRRKSTYVFNLSRSSSGRILSLSPYEACKNTNLTISRYLRYRYSHLSKQIHKSKNDRSKTMCLIDEIIPVSFNQYVHLYLNDFEKTDIAITAYCKEHKLPLPSKEKIKRLKKLITKWKLESQDYHYKLTKQEKRKLKKKFCKSIK